MPRLLAFLALIAFTPLAVAQSPTLNSPVNLGAKPGTAVELTFTGTNLLDVSAVWLSLPGKVTVPPGQTDAAKLKVKLELPADAAVGTHVMRVVTKAGVSNLRPLCVDELPEVAEAADNRSPEKAQAVPGACVVVGKADNDAADFFRVPVKAGVPVTFEVLARRLGSPLDPLLILRSADGKELGGQYADDTPGLQSDARLMHTPAKDGDLIVELRDSTYRGGEFRLRIGSFPGATTAFPLAIERGKSTPVGFAGPDAVGAKPVTVSAPTDPLIPALTATPKRDGGVSGWHVAVRLSDFPEAVEQEPNDTPTTATKLPVPGGMSAKFEGKQDVDHFAFPGKKGQKLVVTVLTTEVNSPVEVYLRVHDSAGKELAKSDPTKPGTRVDFTPAADGEFVAACEHVNYLTGPTEIYHLSVRPATPDFAVTLGSDRAEVPAGAVGVVSVTGVSRLNGFAAPVELSVIGAEGISGMLTIPPGANPTPAAPLFLPLTAKVGTKPGAYPVRVQAMAKDVVRLAEFPDALRTSFGNLPNPPAEFAGQLVVGVLPAPPFTLTVKLDPSQVTKAGAAIKGTVTATRTEGFAEEIVLAGIAPANVTAKFKPIAKGAASAEFEVTAAASAVPGPGSLQVKGTAKVGGKDVAVSAVPVSLTVVEAKKK